MTTTPTTQPDLLAILEDRGYRATGSRRDVVNLLAKKLVGFSAEEISSELPGVGRATVYRTIRLLLEAGVICKLALLDGAPKYSLARVEHHHHTVCVKCGTVGEFRAVTIERAPPRHRGRHLRRDRGPSHRVLHHLPGVPGDSSSLR